MRALLMVLIAGLLAAVFAAWTSDGAQETAPELQTLLPVQFPHVNRSTKDNRLDRFPSKFVSPDVCVYQNKGTMFEVPTPGRCFT